jgi:hypothetical protein
LNRTRCNSAPKLLRRQSYFDGDYRWGWSDEQ